MDQDKTGSGASSGVSHPRGNEPQTNPFIRYIGTGSKFDYLVRVAQAGRYILRVSIDAEKPGTNLDILVNNSPVQTVIVPARGANVPENTFRDTTPITLLLPAGLSVIRLHVPSERPYNINSLKVTRLDGTGIAAAQPMFGGFQFFWQQETSPGKPVTQQFSVSDAKTPASELLVSAHSDDPKLLPETSIVLARDPKNAGKFTFTAAPEPGKVGQVNIIFTVRNAAGLTRSAQVRIIVR